MALYPYFAGVTPATDATMPVDSGGKFYVSRAKWNQMMDNSVNWKFNVNAQGNSLANLGSIAAASVSVTNVMVSGPNSPQYVLTETDVGTDAKLWKFLAEGGVLSFTMNNDADTIANPWLRVFRSGASPLLVDIYAQTRLQGGVLLGAGATEYAINRQTADGTLGFSGTQPSFTGYRFLIRDAGNVLRDALGVMNSGLINQGAGGWMSIGNAAGNTRSFSSKVVKPGSNTIDIREYASRGVAGATWDGVNYVIDMLVDTTHQSCGMSFSFNALRLYANSGTGPGMIPIAAALTAGFQVASSAWNGPHFIMGSYHEWYDAAGRKRSKNGAPVADTDGVIIGTQS